MEEGGVVLVVVGSWCGLKPSVPSSPLPPASTCTCTPHAHAHNVTLMVRPARHKGQRRERRVRGQCRSKPAERLAPHLVRLVVADVRAAAGVAGLAAARRHRRAGPRGRRRAAADVRGGVVVRARGVSGLGLRGEELLGEQRRGDGGHVRRVGGGGRAVARGAHGQPTCVRW